MGLCHSASASKDAVPLSSGGHLRSSSSFVLSALGEEQLLNVASFLTADELCGTMRANRAWHTACGNIGAIRGWRLLVNLALEEQHWWNRSRRHRIKALVRRLRAHGAGRGVVQHQTRWQRAIRPYRANSDRLIVALRSSFVVRDEPVLGEGFGRTMIVRMAKPKVEGDVEEPAPAVIAHPAQKPGNVFVLLGTSQVQKHMTVYYMFIVSLLQGASKQEDETSGKLASATLLWEHDPQTGTVVYKFSVDELLPWLRERQLLTGGVEQQGAQLRFFLSFYFTALCMRRGGRTWREPELGDFMEACRSGSGEITHVDKSGATGPLEGGDDPVAAQAEAQRRFHTRSTSGQDGV